jgi:hypothetical protein
MQSPRFLQSLYADIRLVFLERQHGSASPESRDAVTSIAVCRARVVPTGCGTLRQQRPTAPRARGGSSWSGESLSRGADQWAADSIGSQRCRWERVTRLSGLGNRSGCEFDRHCSRRVRGDVVVITSCEFTCCKSGNPAARATSALHQLTHPPEPPISSRCSW